MSQLKSLRLIYSWTLILSVLFPLAVAAQTAPASEKQKIESLIKEIGDLNEADFVRNG
jgi:hypothetical protein